MYPAYRSSQQLPNFLLQVHFDHGYLQVPSARFLLPLGLISTKCSKGVAPTGEQVQLGFCSTYHQFGGESPRNHAISAMLRIGATAEVIDLPNRNRYNSRPIFSWWEKHACEPIVANKPRV